MGSFFLLFLRLVRRRVTFITFISETLKLIPEEFDGMDEHLDSQSFNGFVVILSEFEDEIKELEQLSSQIPSLFLLHICQG
jgi:hypothetical protein